MNCAPAFFVAVCAVATAVLGQTRSAEVSSECSAYASVSLPADAAHVSVPTAFPTCASYRSYRGIGRPKDYSAARSCAWQERLAQKADLAQNPKEPTAWVVGGSLILADIYFNGAGVDRDIRLAMRLACEVDEGLVKLAVPAIAKLNLSATTHGPVELCDYATTTFMMSFCSAYKAEIKNERTRHYFDTLKTSMNSEQVRAFEKLLSAQNAYLKAHIGEVDQRGTIRSIRTTSSLQILQDLFRTNVVHFERNQWPTLSANQVVSTDALLGRDYNRALRQLRTHSKNENENGAVTDHQLATTQRVWEGYREAWVAFARLRYPAAVAIIRAQITLEKCRLLKAIQ